jgi:hypothetical protein
MTPEHPSTHPMETGRHFLAAASIHTAAGASRAAPPSLRDALRATLDPPAAARTPTTTRQPAGKKNGRLTDYARTDAGDQYGTELLVEARLTVDCKSVAKATEVRILYRSTAHGATELDRKLPGKALWRHRQARRCARISPVDSGRLPDAVPALRKGQAWCRRYRWAPRSD